MDFLAITIANAIWILYSMSEGLREGFFEYFKNKSKRECAFNTKRIFNIQRGLVLLATGGVLAYTLGWISIPFIIAQFFMFRYFHKIIFDQTIKKLDIKNSIIEQKENPVLETMDKEKSPMVLFGIGIQIFIYLFLM
jgi:hypothetical protein